MGGNGCDKCGRWEAAGGFVSHCLQVEIGNADPGQTHLVATLKACIQALGPNNLRLHPRPAQARAMEHPAPGEEFDEQAARLAANCAPGYEEAEAVILRRAADILMARAHGRQNAYRGAPRGAYGVPLRWVKPDSAPLEASPSLDEEDYP